MAKGWQFLADTGTKGRREGLGGEVQGSSLVGKTAAFAFWRMFVCCAGSAEILQGSWVTAVGCHNDILLGRRLSSRGML